MRGLNPQNKFKNLGNMTVGFGGKTRGEDFHPGLDFANVMGTPIPATVDAVVTKVVTGKPQGSDDFGNTVEFKDAEGNVHQYHHLQNVNVKQGEQIRSGQEIATMGNSGNTYSQSGKGDGTHLDYRVVDAYKRYKNPELFLKNL